MGRATRRQRAKSHGQYLVRKDRRRTSSWQPAARAVAPWYCFPLTVRQYEEKMTRERIEKEARENGYR